MPSAAVAGANQLRAVGVRLRAAGSEGRGLRRRMNRNLKAAVIPMRDAVRAAIGEIPAKGPKSTGLRAQMQKATKIRIRATGATAFVRLEVDPGAMPAGKEALPALMDGQRPWRHPVYGNRNNWVPQSSHEYFERVVRPRIVAVRAAVNAAVKETAATI